MSALPASAYPSRAAIVRTCRAAVELGMKVVRFRVEPGGAITVWDATDADPPADAGSELDVWRARKGKS